MGYQYWSGTLTIRTNSESAPKSKPEEGRLLSYIRNILKKHSKNTQLKKTLNPPHFANASDAASTLVK